MKRAGLICAFVLAGCAAGPSWRPSSDASMRVYTLGKLSFEAPADWTMRGTQSNVKLVSPDELARLEVRMLEVGASEPECMASAEHSLERGSPGLQKIRRSETTVAGRRALAQEADAPVAGSATPWHGWAYAICDGGTQYRIFFTGLSPIAPDTLGVHRRVVSTAKLDGGKRAAARGAGKRG